MIANNSNCQILRTLGQLYLFCPKFAFAIAFYQIIMSLGWFLHMIITKTFKVNILLWWFLMQDNHFCEIIILTSWSSWQSLRWSFGHPDHHGKCGEVQKWGRNLLFALITASSLRRSLLDTCFNSQCWCPDHEKYTGQIRLTKSERDCKKRIKRICGFALITASSLSLRLPDTCFNSQCWCPDHEKYIHSV